MTLRLVPLAHTTRESREAFSSANESLDRWLTRSAVTAVSRGTSRVFCLVFEPSRAIAGHYALSAHVIAREALPSRQAHGLPGRIPAVLIGKLARDQSHRGAGIGELLLMSAHRRIVQATRTVAARYVVVDAIDRPAQSFYERYGYRTLPTSPTPPTGTTRLYRRVSDIAAEFDPASRIRKH